MKPTSMSPVVMLDEISKSSVKPGHSTESFTVHPDEFVAVISRSGAGKTTVLRCLSRAAVASEGRTGFSKQDLARLTGRALSTGRASG